MARNSPGNVVSDGVSAVREEGDRLWGVFPGHLEACRGQMVLDDRRGPHCYGWHEKRRLGVVGCREIF
jgi:hypothetical protein